jgi:hypothetical protein
MLNLIDNSTEFTEAAWRLAVPTFKALHPEAVPKPDGGLLVCNRSRKDNNPGVSIDPAKGLATDWAIQRTWTNPAVALAQLTPGHSVSDLQHGFKFALGLVDDLPATAPQVFRDLRIQKVAPAAPEETAQGGHSLKFHPISAADMQTLPAALPAGVRYTAFEMKDTHGVTRHVEVRYEHADGSKDVRPYSLVSQDDGSAPHWRSKAPDIAQLFGTETVVANPGTLSLFVEGPKTAAAAQGLFGKRVSVVSLASNLLARTSFTVLQNNGAPVIVWPDNDPAGFQHAARVAAKLGALGIAHIVIPEGDLSRFPAKWDLADPVPPELPASIVHDILAKAISRLPRGPDPSLIQLNLGPVAPFPMEVLPQWARELVTDFSAAASAPPDYVACTLFAVVGSLATGRFPVTVHPGFKQHTVLFMGNAGSVSQRKSPAQRAILDSLDRLQGRLTDEYKRAHAAWEAAATAARTAGTPVPEEPKLQQVTTSNATTESIAVALGGNDGRAILMATDELDEWLSSLHRYNGGKSANPSGDIPTWLTLFDPRRNFLLNRASFNRGSKSTPLNVRLFGAGVVGSLQDDILRQLAASDMERSVGLLPRMLLVRPDHRPVTPLSMHPHASRLREHDERLDLLFRTLYDAPADGTGLVFSDEALARFTSWYTEADHRAFSGFADQAHESKASGHIARLAGILHLLKHGMDPGRIDPTITLETVQAAMDLRLRYFRSHAKRISRICGEPEHERLARVLALYIVDTQAQQVNPVTVKRDARLGGMGNPSSLLAALVELVDARWLADPGGVLRDATGGGSGGSPRLPDIDLRVAPAVHRLPAVLQLRQIDASLEAYHA